MLIEAEEKKESLKISAVYSQDAEGNGY